MAVENPPPDAQKGSASKKCKQEVEKTTEAPAGAEFQELKRRLKCEKHSEGRDTRWCYINAFNAGEHVPLTLQQLSLWARKIVSCICLSTTLLLKYELAARRSS